MFDNNSFNEREQVEIDALERRDRSIYKFGLLYLYSFF
jgi:hypothetical protein